MPDLATVAEPFPVQSLQGRGSMGEFTIPWACHNATCAWLYEAEYSRMVTGVEFQTFFSGAGPIMKDLAKQGTQVATPISGNASITAGSLLVFFDGNAADHSCVMKTSD